MKLEGQSTDALLQQAMEAVEALPGSGQVQAQSSQGPQHGDHRIKLPKAKHRKSDKALKAAAVLQEMLATDKATGEVPSAAFLEEAMAEQEEAGPDQVGEGSSTKHTCVEPEDPRGWVIRLCRQAP
ncbi:hypothetical protein CYMTET_13167 [Cymbomonas tetramitiformis]|uniref:Uncharacterized protein n=1 Tax=Cymbomonas tetramitiformis TaxID=36881 RepID=A0AAE0LBG5_9CHLO|nr:hypothetical protein CYMTET_13167 [Cymbomonas tetramitiformis]